MRSQLGRARGLGSAKEGVGHWWAQRVTAVALVPLSLWFTAAILCLAGADYLTVRDWLASPVTLTLMSLFLAMLAHHAVLGLQVVIEDYVHRKWVRLVAVLGAKFAGYALAAAGIVAMLSIAIGR